MKLESKKYQEGDYEKHIRTLTKTNMQELFKKNFGGWSNQISDKKFKNIINDETGHVELFFIDDLFVGYVSYNEERNQKNSYLINDIHIEKEFQQQGHGTTILNETIAKVKKLGANQVKVFVFLDNPAFEFYKANQFQTVEKLEKSNSAVMVRLI